MSKNPPDDHPVLGRDWFPSLYGADDELGAGNLLGPRKTLEAVRLIRSGEIVRLGFPYVQRHAAFARPELRTAHARRPERTWFEVLERGSRLVRRRALPSALMMGHGIYLHEGLNLDALAATRRYEFAYVFSPLPIVGATGSPGTPLAVL